MSVQTETVQIATPAGPMTAQVARPAGAEKRPAVIVIQEAFGLNGHIRDVGTRIAAEGYVTVAPDLFHRGGALQTAGYDELPKALQLMGALTDDGILDDVRGVLAYLKGRADVRAD